MATLPMLATLLLGATLLAFVPENHDQLQQRADAGDSTAQFELAVRLGTGDGIKQDQQAALTWITRAAAGGHAEAQWMLSALILRDAEDDEGRAAGIEWLRRAADQGRVEAIVWLAMNLHEKGDNVAALDLFRRAAATGDAELQFILGMMLRNGELGAKEPVEASRWMRSSATQGHQPAQVALGAMYANADGVPRNDLAAYFWVLLAADESDYGLWLRNELETSLDEQHRDRIRASASAWSPGRHAPPDASGVLEYTRFLHDEIIDDNDRMPSKQERWTIIDAAARRQAFSAVGEFNGERAQEGTIQLLLSPVPIDHAYIAERGAGGMGLAVHYGVTVYIDPAGRPIDGMLVDGFGYTELAFDAAATDLVVRDGLLTGTLKLDPSHAVGVGPGLTIDVSVAAPMQ